MQRRSTLRAALTSTLWSAIGLAFAAPASAETRSYVLEWFSQASYSQDGDCPGGVNPPTREQYVKNLADLGVPPAEREKLLASYNNGDEFELREFMRMRGRIDGKPVNSFAHPWTAVDPKLTAVAGKFAYGFNLDGKTTALSFEDPQTKEQGVDNQLFRALGCIEQFRGTFDFRPTFWDFIWNSMKETSPAWLMSVTGDNLDSDGPVTITFDRAMEHLMFSASGEATADVTYRADPDPRSHHSFEGEIKDGVLRITKPGFLRLLQDSLSFPEFVLEQANLRMTIKPDGSLDGFIGGYQPWREVYYGIAQGGLAYEGMIVNDIVGIYYLLRKHADAFPDEKGENRSISTAYHIEAVPAFVVGPDEAQRAASSSRQQGTRE
jgi:hypothetical protein